MQKRTISSWAIKCTEFDRFRKIEQSAIDPYLVKVRRHDPVGAVDAPAHHLGALTFGWSPPL
jgi:hypothetical protein